MSDAPQELANFLYHCTSTENNVKFMHQSLCNPPKLSLFEAIRRGFLRGAPHLKGKKCSQISPAKHGHLKRPHEASAQGNSFNHSKKQPCIQVLTSVLDPSVPGLIEPHDPYADDIISHMASQYNIIDDVDDQTIANVFCFGAFTDEISGVIYNDCTGKFPYMSLDGNVSFFL
jgi:hypothetical protein